LSEERHLQAGLAKSWVEEKNQLTDFFWGFMWLFWVLLGNGFFSKKK